jgi:hypothetical protein
VTSDLERREAGKYVDIHAYGKIWIDMETYGCMA